MVKYGRIIKQQRVKAYGDRHDERQSASHHFKIYTSAYLSEIFFKQFYNMVDSIIVGRFVGADALAAVGSTGTIMFLVIGFSQGMSTGFTVLPVRGLGLGMKTGRSGQCANGNYPVIICYSIYDIHQPDIHEKHY